VHERAFLYTINVDINIAILPSSNCSVDYRYPLFSLDDEYIVFVSLQISVS